MESNKERLKVIFSSLDDCLAKEMDTTTQSIANALSCFKKLSRGKGNALADGTLSTSRKLLMHANSMLRKTKWWKVQSQDGKRTYCFANAGNHIFDSSIIDSAMNNPSSPATSPDPYLKALSPSLIVEGKSPFSLDVASLFITAKTAPHHILSDAAISHLIDLTVRAEFPSRGLAKRALPRQQDGNCWFNATMLALYCSKHTFEATRSHRLALLHWARRVTDSDKKLAAVLFAMFPLVLSSNTRRVWNTKHLMKAIENLECGKGTGICNNGGEFSVFTTTISNCFGDGVDCPYPAAPVIPEKVSVNSYTIHSDELWPIVPLQVGVQKDLPTSQCILLNGEEYTIGSAYVVTTGAHTAHAQAGLTAGNGVQYLVEPANKLIVKHEWFDTITRPTVSSMLSGDRFRIGRMTLKDFNSHILVATAKSYTTQCAASTTKNKQCKHAGTPYCTLHRL